MGVLLRMTCPDREKKAKDGPENLFHAFIINVVLRVPSSPAMNTFWHCPRGVSKSFLMQNARHSSKARNLPNPLGVAIAV